MNEERGRNEGRIGGGGERREQRTPTITSLCTKLAAKANLESQ